ncbi:hypothetical protein LXL04_039269 [Taraxacum kok-saghyz]
MFGKERKEKATKQNAAFIGDSITIPAARGISVFSGGSDGCCCSEDGSEYMIRICILIFCTECVFYWFSSSSRGLYILHIIGTASCLSISQNTRYFYRHTGTAHIADYDPIGESARLVMRLYSQGFTRCPRELVTTASSRGHRITPVGTGPDVTGPYRASGRVLKLCEHTYHFGDERSETRAMRDTTDDQYCYAFAYYLSVLMSLLRVTIKIERDHLEDIHRDRDMQERSIQIMSDYTGEILSRNIQMETALHGEQRLMLMFYSSTLYLPSKRSFLLLGGRESKNENPAEKGTREGRNEEWRCTHPADVLVARGETQDKLAGNSTRMDRWKIGEMRRGRRKKEFMPAHRKSDGKKEASGLCAPRL